MKKLFYLFTSILIASSILCCENEIIDQNLNTPTSKFNNEASKVTIHKSKLQNREFISESLMYNPIGNDSVRKMQVYTPPGYHHNKGEGYPVVYLLHGEPLTEKAYIDYRTWDDVINPDGFFKYYPDFPSEGFQTWIDNLIQDGIIEPMIIVMPNAENLHYGYSWYTDSSLNGNFEQYITTDLVNFIDKRYNTIANKNGRAVIGHSQGGYGAIKIGMKHSDKFSVIAAHGTPLYFNALPAFNPYLVAENPDGLSGPDPSKYLTSGYYSMAAAWSPNLLNPPFMVDLPMEFPSGDIIVDTWARWLEHDPYTMLDTYGDNFKTLKGIYFDCGIWDEFNWGATYPYFTQKLNDLGINYTYKDFEGGHFDKTYSRLEISLAFCSEAMK